MPTDFLDAHQRHWSDAEWLFNDQRWANADQLYALAAECGLKRLMLAVGMPFDTGKDRPDDALDRKHAEGIWARYESYRCGHPLGTAYVLPAPNPFSDWHISQRYAHHSDFDPVRVKAHRAGAAQVSHLIKQAARDGLL